MDNGLALVGASIVDGTGRDPFTGTVIVNKGRIVKIDLGSGTTIPRGYKVWDLTGKTIFPGLIDAHAHVALVEAQHGSYESKHPGAVYAFTVAKNLEDYLKHGFTTIRDAGGCTWSFKEALRKKLIAGPNLYISNSFISQTGGHGDHRLRTDASAPKLEHPLHAPPAIADGSDAVSKAAREQLRAGADQIKIMAGGGVASPTDALETPQYTLQELKAAVYEADAVGKYVLAHVYVPQGIQNCIDAGIRSIEHGNFLTEELAMQMREANMYLIPTLGIYELISELGPKLGMSKESLAKNEIVMNVGHESLKIAIDAGVKVGSGSDVFGPYSTFRAFELEVKSRSMGAIEAVKASTKINAELMGIGDSTGTVETGKIADLTIVDGDPLADMALLNEPSNIAIVIKEGCIMKDTLEKVD